MHEHARAATGAGFFAILLWSASIALSRGLTEKLGPLGAGATVYLLAGVFALGPRLLTAPRATWTGIRRWPRRYVLGCGGLFVLYGLAYYTGLGLARDRGQAVEIGLLNYLWPALTVVFAIVLLPVRAGWPAAPGIALALAGVWLAQTTGGPVTPGTFAGNVAANPLAYAGGLVAGFSWALYSVLSRRWAPPAGSGSGAPVFLLATGLLLALVRLAMPDRNAAFSRAAAGEAFALALAMAVSYQAWDLAMRRGNFLLVGAVSYATPVLSTLFAAFYLSIAPAPRVWFAATLVFAGSLISGRHLRHRPPSDAPRETPAPPTRPAPPPTARRTDGGTAGPP